MYLAISAVLYAGAVNCAAQDITAFESLIQNKDFSVAVEKLEPYVAQHPDSWEAHYQLGYARFRLHRLQPSVEALCKSILLKGDFAESHKILAFDLNMLSHPELARPELQKAIALDAKSFESHYELGRIDYELGSYTDAVEALERAKELDLGNVKVYHNLGLAYAAIGKDTAAVESFEKGLQLNTAQPTPSAWPLIDYATYCNTQRQFAKAKDLLLRAVEIDATWDREFEELGKAYRGLDQPAEAIKAFRKAAHLNPQKAEYHYELSRLYRQDRREPEAKAELAEFEHLKK